MTLTVGQLRAAIADLPDDMPVMVDDSEGPWWSAANAYIAQAHRHRQNSWIISNGRVNHARICINVLLVRRHGLDDAEDITPKEQP